MEKLEHERWIHLLRGWVADINRLPRAEVLVNDKEALADLDAAIDDISERVTAWYNKLVATGPL